MAGGGGGKGNDGGAGGGQLQQAESDGEGFEGVEGLGMKQRVYNQQEDCVPLQCRNAPRKTEPRNTFVPVVIS